MTVGFLAGTEGGLGIPTQSLRFSRSNSRYLSISNANWGSYDRSKFAIAGAFYLSTSANGNYGIINRREKASTPNEFSLTINKSEVSRDLAFQSANGASFGGITSQTDLLHNTWYAFLVHFDLAASSGDRLKMWLNGSPVTASAYTAPTLQAPTLTVATEVGLTSNNQYMQGDIYGLTFFDGVLPNPAQVFDGTAGKLKNMRGIVGAKSGLYIDKGVITDDAFLTPNWTNNNGVTAVDDVP